MMLKLFDKNHVAQGILNNCSDIIVETTLKNGQKTIQFKVASTNSLVDLIQEEGYLQTEDYEFVIKEFNKQRNDFYDVVGKANVELLTGAPVQHFESLTQNVGDTVALALALTSQWTYINNSQETKRRTVRKENGTVMDVLTIVKGVYGVELEFDTLNKIVYIYDQRGTDRGSFFTDQHDMSEFTVQSTSYNFITRLYAFGANDENGTPINISSVNGGLTYVENHTWSDKDVAAIWIDQRYTIPQNLKDDAIEKLAELAMPARSYSCKLLSLDKKELQIGDTITFLDSLKKTREKQRVVVLTEYIDKPENTTVQLANTRLSFSDKQEALDEAARLIENNTNDAGVIAYAVDAGHAESGGSGGGGGGGGGGGVPDPLIIGKIIVGELEAEDITATDIRSDYATIGSATIPTIHSTDIETEYITADAIQTTDITVRGGYIGYLTSENFRAHSISGDILRVDEAFIEASMIKNGVIGTTQISDASITDAKIVELTANKITSGTLAVERLIIYGNNKSIIFAINNAGELVSQNTDTIDGAVLTDRTVTADKIVAGAITSNELAARTILANNIASNTITSNEIAAGTVTSTEIAAETISTSNLAAYSVTSDKLASGSITSDKIDAKSVFLSNLSDDVFDEVRKEVREQLGMYQQDVEQYMNFDPNTGLTLGSTESDFAVNISNSEIDFKEGNATVAYINNDKFSINNGEVLNEFRIGNYVFRPRANGNMSLIYEEV